LVCQGIPSCASSLATFALFSALVLGVFSFFFVKYDRIDRRALPRSSLHYFGAYLRPAPAPSAPGDHVRRARNWPRFLGSRRDTPSETENPRLGPTKLPLLRHSNRPPDRSPIMPLSPPPSRFTMGIVDSISGGNGPPGGLRTRARHGPLPYPKLASAPNGNWSPIRDIPKVLVNAVLAIEDRRFFQHGRAVKLPATPRGRLELTSPIKPTARAAPPSPCSFLGPSFCPREKDLQAQADGDDDRSRTGTEIQQKSKSSSFTLTASISANADRSPSAEWAKRSTRISTRT